MQCKYISIYVLNYNYCKLIIEGMWKFESIFCGLYKYELVV